ncbi:La protein-like protein [Phanerochaete sordida]|uniref:La protein-like protein n=1 Tax=Phanerochaete sordida TaxID=48140 RepID=A0A9P3G699_9APHY|nr:La protein-like protein [Phanerochaete sordida]
MDAAAAPVENVADLKAEEAKPTTTPEVSDAAPVSQEASTSTPAADGTGDVTMSEEDEKDKALRAVRQIEFYFADANLPYDKFMWTLHTANPEHWVPISTVASFKRMREFTPLGNDWLANALKSSASLEVDETNSKVRRRTEVTEPKGQFERSVYAKGFGEEVPGLQQKLEAFFNQYGRTNAVRMRREENTKNFKGSVFVEFDDMSSVEKFLSADPKPTWDGKELLIMSKEAYCEMKIKEKGLTGKAAQFRKEAMGGAGRKGFNAFKEMADKKGGKAKGKPEVFLDFLGQRIRVHEEDGGSVKPEDIPFVKGATLKFDGAEGDVSFDEIKAPLKERFARVPFVQYNKGDTWGYVAFDKALSEEDVAYVREKIGTLSAKPVTWSFLDEDTEKTFQIERASAAAKRALHFSQKDERGSGGRGRGRGGARGGRGRGGRGGRGGARGGDRRDKGEKADKPADEQAGDKRKRTIEPDGGAFVGARGQGVPAIASAKKPKTDE